MGCFCVKYRDSESLSVRGESKNLLKNGMYPNTSSSDRGHYSRSNFFLPCGLFIRSAPFNICKTFPHHHTSNKERTMLEIEQITSKHCYIFKKIRNPLKHKLMS